MTPQEELFAKLFNHEKVLVKNMDLLTLRAHREELCKIAFEARARITAVDEIEREFKKKHNKIQGFERSINTNEMATNAINAIKERQKRMSKVERILEGLKRTYENSGMSPTEAQREAERVMSAGTILARSKTSEEQKEKQAIPKSITFNPFAKKGE